MSGWKRSLSLEASLATSKHILPDTLLRPGTVRIASIAPSTASWQEMFCENV